MHLCAQVSEADHAGASQQGQVGHLRVFWMQRAPQLWQSLLLSSLVGRLCRRSAAFTCLGTRAASPCLRPPAPLQLHVRCFAQARCTCRTYLVRACARPARLSARRPARSYGWLVGSVWSVRTYTVVCSYPLGKCLSTLAACCASRCAAHQVHQRLDAQGSEQHAAQLEFYPSQRPRARPAKGTQHNLGLVFDIYTSG